VEGLEKDDSWELKEIRDDPRFAATFGRKK
jgi:hypothetical protein